MNGELVPGEEDRSGEGESGDRSLVNSAVGVVCGVSVRVRLPFFLRCLSRRRRRQILGVHSGKERHLNTKSSNRIQ